MITKTIAGILLVAVLLVGRHGMAATSGGAEGRESNEMAETQIRQLIERQVKSWNSGDLEGFMAGYWNSPELTFFSNDAATKGWQATLDRYRKRYQGEGRAMGTLDFTELQVQVLGSDAAFVQGGWHLKMQDGKEPHGMFTLLLRRFPEGWRIVHDHSSGG